MKEEIRLPNSDHVKLRYIERILTFRSLSLGIWKSAILNQLRNGTAQKNHKKRQQFKLGTKIDEIHFNQRQEEYEGRTNFKKYINHQIFQALFSVS